MEVVHAALFVASVLAVADAALRLASLASERGLERALAAATAGTAWIVIEPLALGLAGGLGGEPWALAAGCGLIWLAARHWLPAPEPGGLAELRAWLGEGGPVRLGVAGALTGVAAAICAWLWHSPGIGEDGSTYHLAEVQEWIASGHPGRIVQPIHDFPVGNYPLSAEVMLTWGMGLARSFAPLALWTVALVVLLGTAGWCALRHFGVPAQLRWLALGAFGLSPALLIQLNLAGTDLAMIAWLATGAALLAAASARPALLAYALVALALAVGIKTSAGSGAAAIVAIGAVVHRRRLRELARPLTVALAVALVVGGTWYIRNLVLHGSPLWPFADAPWGTEQPRLFGELSPSLLQRPRETLFDRLDAYQIATGGAVVLVLAVPLTMALVRTRAVLAAGGAALVALLIWAAEPVTGIADLRELQHLSITTVRYAMPALAVCVLAIALAGRAGTVARIVAGVALATSLLVSLFTLLDRLDRKVLPDAEALAAGALLGAAVALAIPVAWRRVARRDWPRPALAAALTLAAVLVATAAVSRAGDDYTLRHAQRAGYYDQPVMTALANDARFVDGDAPVFATPTMVALLAGDHFDRQVRLLDYDASCAAARAAAARGWLVVNTIPPNDVIDPPRAADPGCYDGMRPTHEVGTFRVYGRG